MVLFEVPLFIEKLNLDNKLILNICKNIHKKDKGVVKSNLGGWHSSSIKKEDFDVLFDIILTKANLFCKKFNKKTPIYFTDSWININNYKDSNQLHFHPHSFLSGVYYIEVPINSGNIVFENPGQDVMCSNWDINDIENFNSLNSPYYKVVPETGNLLLFPSWLKHSVESNMTNKERVSISFNLS